MFFPLHHADLIDLALQLPDHVIEGISDLGKLPFSLFRLLDPGLKFSAGHHVHLILYGVDRL